MIAKISKNLRFFFKIKHFEKGSKNIDLQFFTEDAKRQNSNLNFFAEIWNFFYVRKGTQYNQAIFIFFSLNF